MPDEIYAVPELPYTLTARRWRCRSSAFWLGVPEDLAVSRAAIGNPDSLGYFAELAGKLKPAASSSV